MRDPFPPARVASILALSATQNFYSLRDTATKVMPALCHLTMDPDKSVRDQAFKALKGFVSKLEKVSEDSSLAEQMEADLNVAGSNVSSALAATWASWALGSLTSKFYRTKPSNSQNNTPLEQFGRMTTQDLNNHVELDRTTTSSASSNKEDEEEDPWASLDDKTSAKEPPKSSDGWDDNWLPETEPEFDSPYSHGKNESKSTQPVVVDDSDTLFKEYEEILTKKEPSYAMVKEDDILDIKEPVRPRRVQNTVKERKPGSRQGPMKLGARKIS